MEENTYKVYVKITESGVITMINSSAFLTDTSGWTEIDEGSGDKYYHSQNNYLPHRLRDENYIYNFKLVDGKPELRTEEDKAPELTRLRATEEIMILKANLERTDYIAAKIAEGAATREEYSEQLAQRADWRTRINELENIQTNSMACPNNSLI